jgi:hypothetical protein
VARLIAAAPCDGSAGGGVEQERHHEQRERREEQRAVVRTVAHRLGKLDGDVGRQRPEAVEDVPVEHGRIAGRHQHDHRLTDGAAETDHDRREEAAHGRRDDDAHRRLPGRRAERERTGAQVLGNARQRVLGDRVDDRHDRERHDEADDHRVALHVGPDDSAAKVKASRRERVRGRERDDDGGHAGSRKGNERAQRDRSSPGCDARLEPRHRNAARERGHRKAREDPAAGCVARPAVEPEAQVSGEQPAFEQRTEQGRRGRAGDDGRGGEQETASLQPGPAPSRHELPEMRAGEKREWNQHDGREHLRHRALNHRREH